MSLPKERLALKAPMTLSIMAIRKRSGPPGAPGLAWRAVTPYTPSHGTDRPAPAAGDLGRDPGRRPDADHCSARAHPRAGSPAGAGLIQFLASPFVRPAPGPGAPESAALRPEARRPTRTPRGLPCPAAGRAGR